MFKDCDLSEPCFKQVTRIKAGIYEDPEGSLQFFKQHVFRVFPDLKDIDRELVFNFGVVDSREQFLAKFESALGNSPRQFIVALHSCKVFVDEKSYKDGSYLGTKYPEAHEDLSCVPVDEFDGCYFIIMEDE